MKQVRFKLKAIRDNVPFRPAGYLEEVLASGKIEGGDLVLDEETARKLVDKYSEPNPIEGLERDATKWGPRLWELLHERTRKADFDPKTEARWLSIFQRWIPCGKCSVHWRMVNKKLPADLSSRQAYETWAIAAHNVVNKDLGKPIYKP